MKPLRFEIKQAGGETLTVRTSSSAELLVLEQYDGVETIIVKLENVPLLVETLKQIVAIREGGS